MESSPMISILINPKWKEYWKTWRLGLASLALHGHKNGDLLDNFLETRVIILVAKLPFRHCLGKRRSDPRPFVKTHN